MKQADKKLFRVNVTKNKKPVATSISHHQNQIIPKKNSFQKNNFNLFKPEIENKVAKTAYFKLIAP
jgi:hypothetical protein